MELIIAILLVVLLVYLLPRWVQSPDLKGKANPRCPACKGTGIVEWYQDGVHQMEICDCVPRKEGKDDGDGGGGQV